MKKLITILSIGISLLSQKALAQSTTLTPGSILPNMTSAQRTAVVNPPNGMLVFDSNTQSYWFRQSSAWVELPKGGSTSNYWELNGTNGNELKNTNSGGFWSANPTGLTDFATDISNPPTAPVNGGGTRMMWIPSRSAFRVGTVSDYYKSWDADSIGLFSFASGHNTKARGKYSTAMGDSTTASGNYSTAMGGFTTASFTLSTAMGGFTTASGYSSTAMGRNTTASGFVSTAMGNLTTASGNYSTAMGYGTAASGDNSIAMGDSTEAIGETSTAMGHNTTARGRASTAMGYNTTASGPSSTSMGRETTASGDNSIAMGDGTEAIGETSTAMGRNTNASGFVSTAMGEYSTASGENSTAIGYQTLATGDKAIAMGNNTKATGSLSTAFGFQTIASGQTATAMGIGSTASGETATAMGYNTTASGIRSTTFGQNTTASGINSSAAGWGTIAKANSSFSIGSFNENSDNPALWTLKGSDRIFQIGNGESNDSRSNTLTILRDGRMGINNITSPDAMLHIKGIPNIGSKIRLELNDPSTDYAEIFAYPNYLQFNSPGSGTFLFVAQNGGIKAMLNSLGFLSLARGGNDGRAPLHIGEYGPDTWERHIRLDFDASNNEYGNIVYDGEGMKFRAWGNGDDFYFRNSVNTSVARIYDNGNMTIAGTLTQNSDRRLKTNITKVQNSGTKLAQLQAYNYNWKAADSDPSLQTGLIAQEVQKEFPELVNEGENGYLSVNYIGLIPHLLEAHKELKAENELLKERLAKIEEKLNSGSTTISQTASLK